jgi:hypothetical protein
MKLYVVVFFALLFCLPAQNFAQKRPANPWRDMAESAVAMRVNMPDRQIVPDRYRTVAVDREALKQILDAAPDEFSDQARSQKVILSLPMPDGMMQRFRIQDSPIMEPGLAEKFPEIKTYNGQGLDDPTATVRFDLTPQGFHALILRAGTSVYIDPYAKGDTEHYISYERSDLRNTKPFVCSFDEENLSLLSDYKHLLESGHLSAAPEVTNGTTLRQYRLAMAATGEYTAFHGGTVAGALAAQVTTMNRVNGVYERDLSVRMNFVANNNLIIYTNSATDPYANSSGDLAANQTNLDSVIGTANYDIGHLVGTGGGGVATLNSPCNATTKARGLTGSSAPVGDPFDIDYVAHEIGHQYGGSHTFNGASGNCSGGNRSAANSYEVGSGITIQAYAGICGAQNLAPNSIDTFHVRSLEQMVAFTNNAATGGSCSANSATGNTAPTINGGPDYNIPINTPFSLTATASDVNGDAVTYDWQQYNTGGTTGTTLVPNTDADGVGRPIFRVYLPLTSGTRFYPSLNYINNNTNVPPATYSCATGNCLVGERLPQITRTMVFQVVARDNRAGGGGINTDTVNVNVTNTSGPFQVTVQNALLPVTWGGGSTQTVTWNVASTTTAPVSATNVDILLSTDGGNTYPHTLASGTPNDGTQNVLIPNVNTSQARIKVQGSGNIFFDVNDVNFQIIAATAGPVSVSGRVTDAAGRGLRNVRITLAGGWLAEPRAALTNAFGRYEFTDVPGGHTYLASALSKRYVFSNATRVVDASANVNDADFVAD